MLQRNTTFRLNPQEAIDDGRHINATERMLRDVQTRITSLIGTIPDSWQGLAADRCTQQLQSFHDQLHASIVACIEARTLLTTIDAVYGSALDPNRFGGL